MLCVCMHEFKLAFPKLTNEKKKNDKRFYLQIQIAQLYSFSVRFVFDGGGMYGGVVK